MKTEDFFKSPKNFETLFQSVTDCVIAVNRDYKIIMANDLFRNKVGMSDGDFCFKAWRNRDAKCEDCLVEKCFEDGQIHVEEKPILMRDGKTALMRIKAIPVRDPEEKIVYVLETANYVTEKETLRRELNRFAGNLARLFGDRLKTLEESEDRYRTIFNHSRDGIILTDAQGKVLEINRAGLEELGYDNRAEMIDQSSAMDLFENKEVLKRLLGRLTLHGFVTEFEARLFKRSAGPFDALITSSVILDVEGQITGYVLIVRDVTTRKAADTQIREQNERLAALNAISTTISSSLDLTEVLNTAADRIQALIGSDCVRIYLINLREQRLSLAVHRGLTQAFLAKSHVSSRAVGDGWIGQTVQTGQVHVVDNLLRSDDPYPNHLLEQGFKSTAYIPLVSRGEPVGVLVVSRREAFKFPKDFLEFLTALGNHIGVAVHNAHLYEDIKTAYQDLKDAQEQVIQSEKLASLGKLSASIAHEINNPLAAVLTYVRLLAKLVELGRLTPERTGDLQKYLGIMEHETARCGEMVKNLLAFSRQSGIHMSAHPVDEILDKTILLIGHDLEMRGIRLVREIEADLPAIHCDFRQIQQAILNVLGNASESMAKGGILSVRAGRSNDGRSIEIGISDTGCGIPVENIKHIFEPFFTTKGEGKGVGLGLSIAYGIITSHQGTVDVVSELGKGSTFTVRLPVA